jgi:hypothetical protein
MIFAWQQLIDSTSWNEQVNRLGHRGDVTAAVSFRESQPVTHNFEPTHAQVEDSVVRETGALRIRLGATSRMEQLPSTAGSTSWFSAPQQHYRQDRQGNAEDHGQYQQFRQTDAEHGCLLSILGDEHRILRHLLSLISTCRLSSSNLAS